MTNNSEQNNITENTIQDGLYAFVKLVDELAGDKSNFKISLQNLIINVNKTRVILNGELNFDVARPTEPQKTN